MVGVDTQSIMASMADYIVIACYGPVDNAVDQSISSNLPSMEADLSRFGGIGNNAARFGCRALSEK